MNDDIREEKIPLPEYQSPTLIVLEITDDTSSGAIQIHETDGGTPGLFS